MSARPAQRLVEPTPDPDRRRLAPMRLTDISEVATIERALYAAPWSEGNFVDSLHAGYCAWVLRDGTAAAAAARERRRETPIMGYFVLMAAVGEAHLLNLTVAADAQGQGHGLFLLRRASELAREYNSMSMILEVRPSNTRALSVYRRFGFDQQGLRKRYYPASNDNQQSREDAIVMRLKL